MYRLSTMHSVTESQTDRQHYYANIADHTLCSTIG